MEFPSTENDYQSDHARLLIDSYRRFTGKQLLPPHLLEARHAHFLFTAPFGVVSHNTATDPVFTYGNLTALTLFDMDWEQLTQLPSRKSAEPVNQAERERLLARVTEHGFIDDYSGVRISSSGRRFSIERATVWNLIDDSNGYRGQAAVFHRWTQL